MDDELKDAPEYIDYARQALASAKLLFDNGDWVGATNRAYYAIFYAANAVLDLEGLQRSKHSHVMGLFRQKYVKTSKVEVEFSDIYGKAFTLRNEGDYERAKVPEQAQVEISIERARRFVERIEKLIEELKREN
jgi:uncharacterized protein (UPF0332 family)